MALPTDPQKGLGRAIRRLREESGQTQEDLAHAAGITTTALSRIEGGHRNPTWSTVKRIAEALQLELKAVAELSEDLDRRERRGNAPPPPRRRGQVTRSRDDDEHGQQTSRSI